MSGSREEGEEELVDGFDRAGDCLDKGREEGMLCVWGMMCLVRTLLYFHRK